MNVTESTHNAIDLIAEEFVERFRKGERPAVSEYEARFPEQAEAIRDLFPALVVLENLKPATAPVPTTGQAECASEVASMGKLGDYRIVREIGRGGMGIVYEAVQESLGRQVALKVLPKQLLGDSSRQARFEREARAAARLHHTNIVPVFGVGAENGLHYYAMQYIHGLGLDEVLRELKRLKSSSQDGPAAQQNGERAPEKPERHAVSVTVTQALLKDQFDAGGPQESGNEPSQAAAPPLTRSASEGDPPPARRASEGDTAKSRLSDTARLSESFTLPGLKEAPGTSGKTLWQSIARIGTQVGAALHYAHEQAVLHRDIKPSNLLLDTRGTVWVTDFGLAKADDQRDLTNAGDVLGTLRYMAPEMFSGQADRRSDVYSLGLTLYELLALRPAFDESDRGRLIRLVLHESPPRLRTLDPAIPRDLETIVQKSIEREPAHRYANAQALADDLQRYLADEPIRARPLSRLAKTARWCRRNVAITSLVSAVLVLVAAVAVGSTVAAFRLEQTLNHDRLRLAQTEFLRGQSLCDDGEVDQGLLWMARSLETAESVAEQDSEPWRRVIRMNLESYCRSAHALTEVVVHSPQVGFLAASHAGGIFATTCEHPGGRAGESVRLWDARTGRLLRELSHGGPVSEIVISPDGKWLMTRGLSGLRLWTAAGEPVKLPFLGDGCTRAVFSPDGSRVAAAGPWGIWLWSPEAENLAAQRLPQSAEVRSLALNSNGTRLATYSSDKSLLIWDTTAGKVLGEPITCRVPLGSQSYPRLTFSPDGERLVIDQTNADLIDVNSRKTVDVQHDNRSVAAALAAASRSTFDKQFAHIAFRPDGRVLATCGRDHTVRTWDAATLKPLGPVLKYSPDAEAEFSPDGNLLLVRAGGYMQLWDYKNDKTLGQKMPVSQKTLWIANNSLLTARGGVFLWNVATGHLARPPIGQRSAVRKVAFWPDDASLAAADGEGLHVIGRRTWPGGGMGFVTVNAALSSESDRALMTGYLRSSNDSPTAPSSLFFVDKDLASYSRVPPPEPAESTHPVVISSKGRRAVTFCHATRNSQLWDVDACRPMGAPQLHPLPVFGLAIHPDEQSYVTADMDGTLRRFSAETGEFLATLGRDLPPTYSLAYGSSGKILAVGSGTELRLLADSTGAPVGRVLQHPSLISAIAFASDEKAVATACHDGAIRVWDVATGESLGPALWHEDFVRDIACSRDGRHLLSGGDDRTIRLWLMPRPMTGPAAEVRRQVELLTGRELLGDGTMRLLEPAQWQERRSQQPTRN